jgi:hypothetical protein
MTAARHPLAFVPRLLPAPQAAAYLGVSETKLRALPIPRRMLDGKRLYDVRALDAYADDLPIEGDAPVNGW